MTFALAALLNAAAAVPAAFLLTRRSLLAKVVGAGMALEVGGQAALLLGNGLLVLLSAL